MDWDSPDFESCRNTKEDETKDVGVQESYYSHVEKLKF
jgi:hypothetical protein